MPDEAIVNALKLFELTPPVTQEQLERRRDQLLHTWNPHRFANLTNNPKKYMQMVKKGEAMTKKVEAAYSTLVNWLKYQST
ncbi:hypothetical protein [Nitrospira sp. Nam80]